MTINDADLSALEDKVCRRVAEVRAFYLNSDHLRGILGRIQSLRKWGFRNDGSAMCMQLSGPTGCGKSILFGRYLAQADAKTTPDHVPVLSVTMPPKYTYANFLGAILTGYGTMSFHDRQHPERSEKRVTKLLQEKRTELVMVHDFQHVIDQKEHTAKVPYYAADQIKTLLLDGAKVPVVFNGLPVSDEIYVRNTQLMTRRKYIDHLRPFDWYTEAGREAFKIMVELLAERAGFENHDSIEITAVERAWWATQGVPGNVNTLFQALAELGVRRGTTILTLELLAEAHAQKADAGPGWRNFFNVKYLPSGMDEKAPDQSRVTRLTKQIARAGRPKKVQ